MKANAKFGMASLAIALFLVIVFFTPTEDMQKASDKGEEGGENNKETAYAPWFNEGDP